MLDLGHIKLLKEGAGIEIINVQRGDLPYLSLNEVNYLAFGESDEEYHNELYGFIESEELLDAFNSGKKRMQYNRLIDKGETRKEQKILSEYIRHQIHHPENTLNQRFSNEQLQKSIGEMRAFIENHNS